MDNIIQKIDVFLSKAEKVYFQPEKGEKPPKGVSVKVGPREGTFYETKEINSLKKYLESGNTKIFLNLLEKALKKNKVKDYLWIVQNYRGSASEESVFFLKMALQEMYGGRVYQDDMGRIPDREFDEYREELSDLKIDLKGLKKFIRVLRKVVPEILKQLYSADEIILYRGATTRGVNTRKNTLRMGVLQSFSTSKRQAGFFGPKVFTVKVPIEQIFYHYIFFGKSESEKEVIVLGNKDLKILNIENSSVPASERRGLH